MRAPVPVHGKLSEVSHEGNGVFRGINGPFKATRYHSLVVDRATMPDDLAVTAETDDRLVMALRTAACRCTGCSFIPKASRPSTAISS